MKLDLHQIIRTAALAVGRKRQIEQMLSKAVDEIEKAEVNLRDLYWMDYENLFPGQVPAFRSGIGNRRIPTLYEDRDFKRYFDQRIELYKYLEKNAIWVTRMYSKYLIDRYVKDNLNISSSQDSPWDELFTGDKLEEMLRSFTENRNQLPKAERDLNRYKSIEDLDHVVSKLEGTESVRAKKKREIEEGQKVVHKDTEFYVIRTDNLAATSHFTRLRDDDDRGRPQDGDEDRETNWCVKDPSHGEDYLAGGPLYIIYELGDKVALIHFPSAEFKDLNNDQIHGFQFEELMPALAGILSKEGDIAWLPGLEEPMDRVAKIDELVIEARLEGEDREGALFTLIQAAGLLEFYEEEDTVKDTVEERTWLPTGENGIEYEEMTIQFPGGPRDLVRVDDEAESFFMEQRVWEDAKQGITTTYIRGENDMEWISNAYSDWCSKYPHVELSQKDIDALQEQDISVSVY